MVITLYADRRSPDIADIAGQLASAIALRDMALPVALLASPGPIDMAPDETGRVAVLEAGISGDVGAFLRGLASRYAVTVVALGGAPNEQVLAALDASQRVLLVSDPSVASLRATQRTLKLCASLGYGSDKVAILLHGFADDTAIVPAEAAVVLKREIFGVIPGQSADDSRRHASYLALAERLCASP